jgi:hypothetical protein
MKRYAFAFAGMLALILSASPARATHGIFPAPCSMEHPKRAKLILGQFVQAYVSCGNTGGNTPNTTTEGGVPACTPPETYNEQNGSPPNGWRFNPHTGGARIRISGKKAGRDATDVQIVFRVCGVIDATLQPASGTGALATVARATLQDRGPDAQGLNNDDANMTVVDFPASFPFQLVDGCASLRTSANALLNGIGQPALPHCTSLETVSVTILDENSTTFASLGVFLP